MRFDGVQLSRPVAVATECTLDRNTKSLCFPKHLGTRTYTRKNMSENSFPLYFGMPFPKLCEFWTHHIFVILNTMRHEKISIFQNMTYYRWFLRQNTPIFLFERVFPPINLKPDCSYYVIRLEIVNVHFFKGTKGIKWCWSGRSWKCTITIEFEVIHLAVFCMQYVIFSLHFFCNWLLIFCGLPWIHTIF